MENPHIPLTPETLVSRIGDTLVEKGLLSEPDLEHALHVQAEQRAHGKFTLLGQLLMDLNLVDRATLDDAITEQIINLRAALQNANVQLEKRVQQRTAELENALHQLTEMNQLRTNFVANVSHELRTPLTHIKGYLDLFNSGDLGPITAEQTQALSIMQRSSDRLEHLIEDLLMFSFAEKGQIPIRIQSINLIPVVTSLVNRTTARANELGVTLSLEIDPDLPQVQADPEMIGWVIQHLLDNSIKFIIQPGRVILQLLRDGTFLRVSVTDTGIGIPPNKLESIFNPFYQVDGSPTRKYGGTGLGLNLVEKIMDAHGSIIHVTSEEGKGSCFEFILPTVG